MTCKPFKMWAFFFSDSLDNRDSMASLPKNWTELNGNHVLDHYCLPTQINTLQLKLPVP